MHGGVQALVEGSQGGRGLGQGVRVRAHERQRRARLLDGLREGLPLGLDRGNARGCLLVARTQGINLRAQIGQGALRRQGLLEAAPHARCFVAPALGALAESGHGLGGQGRRIEVRPVFERGR